ncbi:hypothetical protein [Cryptosporangium sp. NPDC051539]
MRRSSEFRFELVIYALVLLSLLGCCGWCGWNATRPPPIVEYAPRR